MPVFVDKKPSVFNFDRVTIDNNKNDLCELLKMINLKQYLIILHK